MHNARRNSTGHASDAGTCYGRASLRMTMPMFEAMGARIEARWAELNHDERAFPELAVRVLDDTPALNEITPEDIVDWALTSPRLPPQFDVRSAFGEPPITLHAGGRFVIDLYFWLSGATATHQHGFSGAFHVLAGSSLHVRSRWTTDERINGDFLLGALKTDSAELLRRGDTRPIEAGDALIHALYHLDRPSCSLVVRTCEEGFGPQYTYLPPSVAYNPFHADPTSARKRELLAMLRKLGHPEWRARTLRLLSACDLPLAFGVLLDTLRHLRSVAELDEFLAATRERHGARVDRLVPALAEALRQQELFELRPREHTAEHRLLFAMLIALPDRAAIDAVIRQRHPDRPPDACLRRWIEELAASSPGAPLDRTDLAVLDGLLRGMSDSEIFDRLAPELEHASGEELAVIFERCHALRSSQVFGRLFAG